MKNLDTLRNGTRIGRAHSVGMNLPTHLSNNDHSNKIIALSSQNQALNALDLFLVIINRLLSKSLRLFLSLMILALATSTVLAQGQFDTNGQIIEEVVEGKYRVLKIVNDDEEIIFRNDRIEIVGDIGSVNETQSFIFFDNCSANPPVGLEMISEQIVQIQNKAMAQTLGTSQMIRRVYKGVLYTGLYPDTELNVSFDDSKAHFKFSSPNPSGIEKVSLKTWDKGALLKKNNTLVFTNQPTISITDASGNLSFDKGAIQMKGNSKSIPTELTFDINLK